MYTKELPKDLKRYVPISHDDRKLGLAHIQSKIGEAAEKFCATKWYEDFLRILRAASRSPELLAGVSPDLLRQAVEECLNKKEYDFLSGVVGAVSQVPELLAVISPDMITQGAQGLLDNGWYNDFSDIVKSVSSQPELITAISPAMVTQAAQGCLDKGWYHDFSLLAEAANQVPEFHAAITPFVTQAANNLLDKGWISDYSDVVKAVSNSPELLAAVKPSAHLEFLSSRETGHDYDVLIAFPKDGLLAELSGGCKHITGLKKLQDHWAAKDDRQVIWGRVVGVFQKVAADPENPSAPIAQRELRAVGLG